MAKHHIAWHEECLKNHIDSLARKEAHLARIVEEVEEARQSCLLYRQQVEEAKRRGLTSFDSERLLQKRRGTTP